MFDAPLETCVCDLIFKGTPCESHVVSAWVVISARDWSDSDWLFYEEMTLSLSHFPLCEASLSSLRVINGEILLNLELIFYFF